MGIAFLAEGRGKWAVVKMVRSDLIDDRTFKPRLVRELDAMQRVGSEYAASIMASDVDADPPWFAMEFIPGVTLARRVFDAGVLPANEVVGLAAALIEVLWAIHSQGIVHRDLKPANIMLSPTGPKLIDFGIADLSEGTQLTRTGSVLGTAGWIAPEQVRGDRATSATDVHAWALSVLFAATGVPPFGADSTTAAIYKVLEFTPEVPVTLRAPLRDLLVAALAKDPSRRPTLERIGTELRRTHPAGYSNWTPGITPAQVPIGVQASPNDHALQTSVGATFVHSQARRRTFASPPGPPATDEPTVSVEVEGLMATTHDGSGVVLTVTPWWLYMNACGEDCDIAEHELAVTCADVAGILEALWQVTAARRKQELVTEGGETILVEWSTASGRDPAGMNLDWSRTFLGPDESSRHEAGEVIPGAYHAVLLMWGDPVDQGSEVGIFMAALGLCSRLSRAWADDQIAEVGVRDVITSVGCVL